MASQIEGLPRYGKHIGTRKQSTKFPKRMAREIKQYKMPANKETLNYLVKKGLIT
jgi:hypothetical protein